VRRAFWYAWARLRLRWLYRGDPPSYEGPQNDSCPNCFRNPYDDQPFEDEFDRRNPHLGSFNHSYGYEGAYSWTDRFRCRRCGTIFEVDNSD